MSNVGVIHEIGDMGFGFDPISKEDQKILEEQETSNTDKED